MTSELFLKILGYAGAPLAILAGFAWFVNKALWPAFSQHLAEQRKTFSTVLDKDRELLADQLKLAQAALTQERHLAAEERAKEREINAKERELERAHYHGWLERERAVHREQVDAQSRMLNQVSSDLVILTEVVESLRNEVHAMREERLRERNHEKHKQAPQSP